MVGGGKKQKQRQQDDGGGGRKKEEGRWVHQTSTRQSLAANSLLASPSSTPQTTTTRNYASLVENLGVCLWCLTPTAVARRTSPLSPPSSCIIIRSSSHSNSHTLSVFSSPYIPSNNTGNSNSNTMRSLPSFLLLGFFLLASVLLVEGAAETSAFQKVRVYVCMYSIACVCVCM